MLKRWAALPRGIQWLVGIAAVVLTLAIVWALFVPATDWLAHHDVGSVKGSLHETAVDNARGRLLTLAAGLFAAGALLYTALTFNLTRQGQVTGRYTQAVKQLGSKKLDVRIGGIYALERIARDSARDHPTVMEVLATFIRDHSHEQWPLPEHDTDPAPPQTTRPDVQAAVTVVGRRNIKYDIRIRYAKRRIVYRSIDLSHAVLPGANLNSATLIFANLKGAYLDGATLIGAHLDGADLNGATLIGAHLDSVTLISAKLKGAHLDSASLGNVDLRGANLENATLKGTDLGGADLRGAFLNRADLRGAQLFGADLRENAQLIDADLRGAHLTHAHLAEANLTGARWPEDAQVPEGWKRDSSGRLEWAGTREPPGGYLV